MTSQINKRTSSPSPLDSLDPLNPVKRPPSAASGKAVAPPLWQLSESKKEEYATRARKMKAVFNKFIGQLKGGCPHEICFSQYCKKNTLSANLNFENDQ